MSHTLEAIGWCEDFRKHFESYEDKGFVPARVVRQGRNSYVVRHGAGEGSAAVTGRFMHEARSAGDYPVVGDWVVWERLDGGVDGRIHAVLPRKSSFSRKMAGEGTQEQIVAVNIDTVFIICGLDGDYNLRRIERYLTVAHHSGARPVIVLNKADVCEDLAGRLAAVGDIAPGVAVAAVSATNGSGMEALECYLGPGRTVVLLGSSGVGKSSLVNCWLGESHMAVQAVREHDSHGRHTTTHREMIFLPGGAAIIDTPGMRELGLWVDAENVEAGFDDIEVLAKGCRFMDCRHDLEPECAVRDAIEQGAMEPGRLESYRKLQRELERTQKRQAQKGRWADKRTIKPRPRRKEDLY